MEVSARDSAIIDKTEARHTHGEGDEQWLDVTGMYIDLLQQGKEQQFVEDVEWLWESGKLDEHKWILRASAAANPDYYLVFACSPNNPDASCPFCCLIGMALAVKAKLEEGV